MARQLEESIPATERTDELPVLSTEAFHRLGQTDPSLRSEDSDSLDRSIEALRDALDTAERRWHQLETRLEVQDRAIGELRTALRREVREPLEPPQTGMAGVPELTEIVPPEVLAAAPPDPSPQARETQDLPVNTPASPQALLERIAWLEAYITGRKDYWRAMESDISAKSQRIAELEQELEQRIARERNMAERLHQDGARSDELRDELQRLRLRLDELRDGSR